MEIVIGFQFLRGRQNDMVVKELSVAGANESETFTLLPAAMLTRRRQRATEPPKKKMNLVKPPDIETCNFYVEAVSPTFDSTHLLHRRHDQICLLRILPHSRVQHFVEFGVLRNNESKFIILNEQQVETMVECVTRMCESLCNNEKAVCKNGNFRLNTTRRYRVAKL